MSKKFWITGGSGLIGRELCRSLESKGHEVHRLSLIGLAERMGAVDAELSGRVMEVVKDSSEPDGRAAPWAPDVVVSLAGAPVFAPVWNTASWLQRVRDSRVLCTQLLVKAFKTPEIMPQPPQVFLSGSAVGAYPTGIPGPEVEESTPLAVGADAPWAQRMVMEWEAAAPSDAAPRVVHLRTGLVLAKEGGMLEPMLKQFSLGLGGYFGSGQQIMPWVSRDDVVRMIEHAVETEAVRGPMNLAAPAVTNALEFAEALGRHLDRKAWVRTPDFVVHGMFGKERAPMVLEGTHVRPKVALETGFEFLHPDLDSALQAVLK